jgi:hypothetical protein
MEMLPNTRFEAETELVGDQQGPWSPPTSLKIKNVTGPLQKMNNHNPPFFLSPFKIYFGPSPFKISVSFLDFEVTHLTL